MLLFVVYCNEGEYFIKYWLKHELEVLLKMASFLCAFPHVFFQYYTPAYEIQRGLRIYFKILVPDFRYVSFSVSEMPEK